MSIGAVTSLAHQSFVGKVHNFFTPADLRAVHQSCQVVIRNESETLNVGMSKPPKVASRPAGGLGGAVSPPAG